MGFKRDEEVIIVEARQEAETPKAYLIEPTSIGPDQCWIPKSQVINRVATSEKGIYEYHITKWIAEKNELL